MQVGRPSGLLSVHLVDAQHGAMERDMSKRRQQIADGEAAEARASEYSQQQKEVELTAWAKQGIQECMRTTRGASMFGSSVVVRAIRNDLIEIYTDSEKWEVQVSKAGFGDR